MLTCGQPNDMDLSPDGQRLAVAGTQLVIWNVETRREVRRISNGRRAAFRLVEFSADGKSLVTCDQGDVCIWDVGSGKLRFRNPGAKDPWWTAWHTPAGNLMLSHFDGAIQVWNATAEHMLGSVLDDWEKGRVDDHVFSPDQRTLYVGRRNSTIMIFDRRRTTTAAAD